MSYGKPIDLSFLFPPPPPLPEEEALMKRMADELVRLYPGYAWGVRIDNGVVLILLVNASESEGWKTTAEKLAQAPNLTKVLRDAGGELLERYQLSRAPGAERKVFDMPRDFRGRLRADR